MRLIGLRDTQNPKQLIADSRDFSDVSSLSSIPDPSS